MRFTITNPKEVCHPPTHLRLCENSDGIKLVATGASRHHCQTLLSITPEGTIHRYGLSRSVAEAMGISVVANKIETD